MTIKFNDGMEFDTRGKLRAERRSDGWYVVGEGLLIPMETEDDALDFIRRLNERRMK